MTLSVIKNWVLITLFLLVYFNAFDLQAADQPQGEDKDPLHFLGSPYVGGDSDVGIEIGLGLGFSSSDVNIVISSNYTTKGYAGISVRGEIFAWNRRWIREIYFYRYLRYAYPQTGSVPTKNDDDVVYTPTNKIKLQIAPLTQLNSGLEIGPELYIKYSQSSNDVEVNNDMYSTKRKDYAIFQRGLITHLGVRTRWRTTSAVRPIDGWLFEFGLRGGLADGEEFDKPKADFATDLRFARANKLSSRIRTYNRIQYFYMHNAPTSVREYIGGGNILRGQPLERDFGRSIISSRSQMYFCLWDEWYWPFDVARSIIGILPRLPMTIEAVAFVDAGAAGDQDYDSYWIKTRYGYGGGMRWMIPPELVFYFDLAKSPSGSTFFYFGAGATL